MRTPSRSKRIMRPRLSGELGAKAAEHPRHDGGRDAEPGAGERRAREVGDVVGGTSADGQGRVSDRAKVCIAARVMQQQAVPRAPARGTAANAVRARGGSSASRANQASGGARPKRCARAGALARSCASSALRTSKPSAYHATHGQLDVREPRQVIDAVFTEMIRADVGHHRHARARDRKPAPQDAAAGDLDDRRPGRAARV